MEPASIAISEKHSSRAGPNLLIEKATKNAAMDPKITKTKYVPPVQTGL